MPEFVSFAISLFFAWLFFVSAWHKLWNRDYYRQILQLWFAHRWGSLLVLPLAGFEFLLAVSLLARASRGLALSLGAALLVVYAAAMGWHLLHGRSDLKCGCAGPGADTTINAGLVWRNLVCAQLAVLASNPVAPGSVTFTSASVALLCAVFLCLLYLCCDQLLRNAQHFAMEKK